MNIKELIEIKNYIVVPDTNIFLNIYKYSPEFADFAIDCWEKVKKNTVIAATTDMEYRKHARAHYGNMKRRVETSKQSLIKQFDTNKDKIINSFNELEKLHYPDIDGLKSSITDKLNEAESTIADFFEERSSISLAASSWTFDLVEYLEKQLTLMPEFSLKELYEICSEGEDRYKQSIPPGFKDAKNKDGIRKYSDLIIWKELIQYSKNNNKNIVFVTDDAKADWWDNYQFHPDLIAEFQKKTKLDIIGCSSTEFYKNVSESYEIKKSDIIEIVLNMTDTDYIDKIQDKVFDEIENDIIYSGDSLLTEDNDVGTEGLNDIDILDHEFVEGHRVSRNDSGVVYNLFFEITIEGYSTTYWGRDDDTKEIITSPEMYHKFKGKIKVEVTRVADLYVDFEDDSDFESAKLVSGSLEQIEFKDWGEEEPEQDYGYGYCPKCGRVMTYETDAGNGFCIECTQNEE